MLKIDLINVVNKLLKIVHSMEHSRSQLKTYIRRISFTRDCLFYWSGSMNDLSLCGLVQVLGCSTNITSVQFNSSLVVIVRL